MVLNDIVAHTSSKVQIKHVPYLNNIVQAFISSDKIDFTALLTMVFPLVSSEFLVDARQRFFAKMLH